MAKKPAHRQEGPPSPMPSRGAPVGITSRASQQAGRANQLTLGPTHRTTGSTVTKHRVGVTKSGGVPESGTTRRVHPKHPSGEATPTGETGNAGADNVQIGGGNLTQLASGTNTGTTSSGSSDAIATITAQLDALSAQVGADESTLSQQQTTLDSLANATPSGATTTASTSGGISGFLSSTAGKLALLGALAVAGWWYLKKKSDGDGAMPGPAGNYEEEGSV